MPLHHPKNRGLYLKKIQKEDKSSSIKQQNVTSQNWQLLLFIQGSYTHEDLTEGLFIQPSLPGTPVGLLHLKQYQQLWLFLRNKPGNTYSDPFDSSSCDLLTVVQLNSLQVVAVLQVFQSHVCDEETVIELQHLQPLVPTCAVAQVKNPIISDQFTVR